jgi:NitT/TauT family transport system permease protein
MKQKNAFRFRQEYVLVPLVFVIVVAAWKGAVSSFHIPPYVLPSPGMVWRQILRNLSDPTFYNDARITLYEVVLGYIFGLLIALALGGLIAEIPVLEKALLPYVVAFQAIPSVTLAPIFVMWFGYGTLSKVVMSALIALFPILVNTIAGLNAYPREQSQMLRVFGGTRWQVFTRVKVPNALPYVFAGMNTGILLALIGAIVGEFIGAKTGLGARILLNNYQFNIAGSFAVIILLAIMGLLLNGAIKLIERKVIFWRPDRDSRA